MRKLQRAEIQSYKNEQIFLQNYSQKYCKKIW